MQILNYLLARFSEPSSYAGFGAVLALLGLHVADPTLASVVQLLTAVCGLLAMALKERGVMTAFLVLMAATPVLSACSELDAAKTAITTACSEYHSIKTAADMLVTAGAVSPATADRVVAIESFGNAACAHPPAGDPLSTAIWLGELAGQIGTLTKAAGG